MIANSYNSIMTTLYYFIPNFPVFYSRLPFPILKPEGLICRLGWESNSQFLIAVFSSQRYDTVVFAYFDNPENRGSSGI